MGKVHTLNRPEDQITILTITDLHLMHLDQVSFSLFMSFAKLIPMPQRKIMILGDTLDLPTFRKQSDIFKDAFKHSKWDFLIDEINKEAAIFDDVYMLLRELVLDPEDIFIMSGNHEDRLNRPSLTKAIPVMLAENFNIKHILKCTERKLQHIDYNDFYRLPVGELLDFTHGMYAGGVNPLRTHFLVNPIPTVIGHTHQEISYPAKTANEDIVRQYHSIPSLCTKEADRWLKGKATGHSNGFGVVNADKDTYNMTVLRIKDHKLFLPTGEVFKV